jgi:capsular polysaccharide transport system permease protein
MDVSDLSSRNAGLWMGGMVEAPVHEVGIGAPVRRSSTDGTFAAALRAQIRVIGAVALRDMRTRFNSYIGFLIAVLWPMAHFGIILGIYEITGQRASYGADVVKWIATGALPFIAFQYPVRFIPMAIMENSSLLSFPAVRSIDIVLARVLVESMICFTVFFAIVFVLAIFNPEMKIYSIGVAMIGIFEALYVGIGMGVFGLSIVRIWPRSFIFLILFTILIWATMGIFFLPDSLPDQVRDYLTINPIMHAAEKIRTGFYPDYVSNTLNEVYLFSVASGFLVVGLIFERFGARFARI